MSVLIIIIILVPLIVGVMIGVWYSRKIRKDISKDIDKRMKDMGWVEASIDKDKGKDRDEDTNRRIAKGFEELLGILKERQEREQAQERDEELVRVSREKLRSMPPAKNPVQQSIDYGDRPANVKANIAIPFNLSNTEKMILEDFYNEKPNDNRRG